MAPQVHRYGLPRGDAPRIARLESVSPQAQASTRNRPFSAGSIVDRGTRRPVLGAVVLVEGTSLTAALGDDGRFRIEPVPAAVYTIRVEAPGYVPLSSPEIKVSANRSISVGDASQDVEPGAQ